MSDNNYELPIIPVYYLLGIFSVYKLYKGEWFYIDKIIIVNKLYKKISKILLIILLTCIVGYPAFKQYYHNSKNTNWLDAYSYVHNHIKKGDAILCSNPATYIFAGGKESSMYFFTEYKGISIKIENNNYVERFFSRPWITDTVQIENIIKNNSGVWFINHISSQKMNFPTTFDFIQYHFHCYFKNSETEVFYIQKNT